MLYTGHLPGNEEYKGYKDPLGDCIIWHNQINKLISDCDVSSKKRVDAGIKDTK